MAAQSDSLHYEVEISSISWRTIFAGAFISLLVFSILSTLGLALGGTAVRNVIQEGGGLGGVGIGSAIWLSVSLILSLFTGSYLSGRVAGPITMRIGRTQGLVIASLFFGFMLTGIGSTVGMIGQGVGEVVGGAGRVAGQAIQDPQVQGMVRGALRGLNLQSPPDVVIRGLATRLLQGDAPGARDYLAAQARISPAEADTRIQAFKDDLQRTAQDAGGTAAQAVSTGAWALFAALVLGALAGMIGGGVGAGASLRKPVSTADRRAIDRSRAA